MGPIHKILAALARCVGIVAILGWTANAVGQLDTTFTFQSVLNENGSPADGTFDVAVGLWNNDVGGTLLAGPLVFDDLAITNGVLTLDLNFGSTFFNGPPRWIEVRINGTPLAPRQHIARTPYAIQTRGMFVDENLNVGFGTTNPLLPLHLANPLPLLNLQDTDSTGAQQAGYISLRDSAGLEKAWFGYGSQSNTDLSIANNVGDVVLSPNDAVIVNDAPVVIMNFGNQAPLLGLMTEQPWEFRQEGTGNSTALKLQSVGGGGDKDLIIQTDGEVRVQTQTGIRLFEIAANSVDAAAVSINGPNGNPNISLYGILPNSGAILVQDENGQTQASLFIDHRGDGHVTGDIKTFRMANPRDLATEIVFACVEGPEAAAYVRGTGKLKNGHAEVELPEYFCDVAIDDGMTVQLTPRNASSKGLAVVEQSVERVVVRELFNGTGNYEFHWYVTAVRRGYEDYQVIRPRQTFDTAEHVLRHDDNTTAENQR